jgi:aminoglycoside phosphotransferase
MQIDHLIDVVGRRHRLRLTPGKRFLWGEQGAFAVADADGRSLVLKWSSVEASERFQRARRITDCLRSKGYPAPRYVLDGVVDGVSYCLQEMLPGQPMLPADPVYLPRLLALNDLQRAPAPELTSDWPQSIVESVRVGCDGYCVLSSLIDYSPETRELLDRVQSLVEQYPEIDCPDDEIVHFDFNPGNILVADGRISGVVDWDGVTAGDRMFDVVTLLFYVRSDQRARQVLWKHLREHSTRGAVSLYLAHMIVRQVDWSIRHHNADSIDLWVEHSGNLLAEL